MPGAMRVEYPGAIYHGMDRGDRRQDIFVNDVGRHDLVKTLAETCEKTGLLPAAQSFSPAAAHCYGKT